MRKWLLFVLVALTALLGSALSGCSPASVQSSTGNSAAASTQPAAKDQPAAINQPAAKDQASNKPQVVTRALTSEPSGLDPQGVAASGQNTILPYLFDTLVYRDLDNTYKPYLAEKWAITPDGKQATITLKPGITFSDGSALDAEAVKFTFDRLIKQGQKSVLASMVTVIDSIQVVDAATIQFNFKEPNNIFLSSLANPYAGIVSAKAVQAEGDGFAQKPVGSGPYTLEKWEPGVAITLAKRADYAWPPAVVKNQAAPHLDKLVFKIIPDVNQQVTALQAGEVDMLFINQPNHVAKLKKDPTVDVQETTLNSLVYLGFNAKKAPFDDPKVRQALAHAVNKDELVQTALGGIGKPAFAPLAPTLPGFDAALKSSELGFDVEKAKSLLKDAGFAQGADGTWSKDGQPLKASLITSTRAPNQALATVLQNQFKAIGVPVEIQALDSAAAQAAMSKGAYDLMLWRYDWNDADVLRVYLSSARIGQTNRNFYSNPEVDQLLNQAAHQMDETARNAEYLKAQQMILQDAVWQPLYTPADFMAFRKEIQGVAMGPMGRVLLNDATRK